MVIFAVSPGGYSALKKVKIVFFKHGLTCYIYNNENARIQSILHKVLCATCDLIYSASLNCSPQGNQKEESRVLPVKMQINRTNLEVFGLQRSDNKVLPGVTPCCGDSPPAFLTVFLLETDEKFHLSGSNCKLAAVGPLNSSRRHSLACLHRRRDDSYWNDCQHAAPAALTD